MCDTFAALPPATGGSSVIFGKSADCEVNEAHALVWLPRRRHAPGAVVRTTHIVIPQAAETHEALLSKSFWTWGCEMGMNEHGLTMGNEGIYSVAPDETTDGLISMDLMRLALERARTCREAIDLIGALLAEFGQGGNCEMRGNSHFDCGFILSDPAEAWVLETAGREWAARQIPDIGSLSNGFTIGSDWDRSSLAGRGDHPDWADTFGEPQAAQRLGAHVRRSHTRRGLEASFGRVGVGTAFQILRDHVDGFHPSVGEVATSVCCHAGPAESRQWQATGAMVTEVSPEGAVAWVTGTAGTCVSIFKPVFAGGRAPSIGPLPREEFMPDTLWWRHELLHRRAIADFDNLVPEIRRDFDELEYEFLAETPGVVKGSNDQKTEFMDYCFQKAQQATERWIERLASIPALAFGDPAYGALWQRFNRQAGLVGLP